MAHLIDTRLKSPGPKSGSTGNGPRNPTKPEKRG
jgi:hypothetical protein